MHIFERGPGPIGASTRNAGFACVGSPTEILADIKKSSFDDVVNLIAKRWEGLARLRTLVGDTSLDLHLDGGYELFTDDDLDAYKECEDLLPDLNQAMRRITGVDAAYMPRHHAIAGFKLGGAEKLIFTQLEGQLDSGKMMSTLLAMARSLGVRISNGVQVTSLHDTAAGVEIETGYGWSITAEKVVVATNGFTNKLLKGLDVRPVRNLVLITHPMPGLVLKGSFHYQEGYYYFRNVGDRILLGGGRNLDLATEETPEFGVNERIRSALTQFLHNLVSPHQHAEPEMWWSGILGVGGQKSPIVDWYSSNIATAVRMGGMGVAIGSSVGADVAALVAKKNGITALEHIPKSINRLLSLLARA